MQRVHMLDALLLLANERDKEKHEAIAKCNPMVAKILTQNGFVRHIPLQRELGFIFLRYLIGDRTIIDVRDPNGRTCCLGPWNDDQKQESLVFYQRRD